MPKAQRYLILPMQPTPNGRLHVGHAAGPYLRADVLTRIIRRHNRIAVLACGADALENWVLYAANKEGRDPEQFAEEMSCSITTDLSSLSIVPDLWVNPLEPLHRSSYLQLHEQFLQDAFDSGICELQEERVPMSRRTGEYAFGAWISGDCPECQREAAGNSCVFCGAGFQPAELLRPRSRLDGSDLIWTAQKSWFISTPPTAVLLKVLKSAGVPQHLIQVAVRQIERDGRVRLSQPGSYGMKTNLVDESSVLSPTFYGFCLYLGQIASALLGIDEHPLGRESFTEVIALFGKDNLGVGLVSASTFGVLSKNFRYFDRVHVNDLLYLEGKKCSTSKKHGIWINEIIGSGVISGDELRFCLCQIPLEHGDQDLTVDSIVESVNFLRRWLRDELMPAWSSVKIRGSSPVKSRDLRRIQRTAAKQLGFLLQANHSPTAGIQVLIDWMMGSGTIARDTTARDAAWLLGFCLLATPYIPNIAEKVWRSFGLTTPIHVGGIPREVHVLADLSFRSDMTDRSSVCTSVHLGR